MHCRIILKNDVPSELYDTVLKEDGCTLIESEIAFLNDYAICQNKINNPTFFGPLFEFVMLK